MYERTIRYYDHPKTDLSKNDCNIAFKGCDPNEPVNILTNTVFNNMSSFIPNEITLIDDRDQIWIKQKIKCLIHEKNLVYKETSSK